MRIRLRQSIATSSGVYAPGQVVDVQDALAEAWIMGCVAVRVGTGPTQTNEDGPAEHKTVPDYVDMTVAELRELAKDSGIKGYSGLKKEELINLLKEHGDA